MFSVVDVGWCKGSKGKRPCGQKVRWTETEAGVPFAVNLAPDPGGNVAVFRDVRGKLRSRRVTDDRPLLPYERLMMPHVATCKAPPKPKPPPRRPPRPTPPAGAYYTVLGVDRDVDEVTLRRVYRRLARELHPDMNPDPVAQERFKEVAEAYEVLSDQAKRRIYDLTGRRPR